MRTRASNKPDEMRTFSDVIYRQLNNGATVVGPDATTPRTIRVSHASSVITDDSLPGRRMKELTHIKVEGKAEIHNSSEYGNSSLLNKYEGEGALWVCWFSELGNPFLIARDQSNPIRATFTRTVEAQMRDALHSFYNDNDVDTLLNIVEAPQLKTSMEGLNSSLSNKTVSRNIREALTLTGGRALRKAVKRSAVASGLYLAYAFGIAPLISDAKKIQKSMQTLRGQLQRVGNSKSKPRLISAHSKASGALAYYTSAGELIGSSIPGSTSEWDLVPDNALRICTVRGYKSGPPYQTSAFKQLDYMMGRFLSSGPATLAWELVPFSFVVDWFVDLRNITDRLDDLAKGHRSTPIDACISEKFEAVSRLRFAIGPGEYPDRGRLLYTEHESYYHRVPVDLPSVGLSGRFGKKQLGLSAALLHQSVAKLVK